MPRNDRIPSYSGKRLLDIVVSTALLIVLTPFCLIVALCVRLLDGGPVIYWQKRVGLRGRSFDFPKFRSMVTDAEALQALMKEQNKHGPHEITFKVERDPRTTRFGRFIRRHSIDEIPQLWCVLKGDMSMVGPRPPTPEEVDKYSAHERQRLLAKPGLTGLWQVSGRSDLSFREQVELDLRYAREQSLLLDLKILLLTIPAVITSRGAY